MPSIAGRLQSFLKAKVDDYKPGSNERGEIRTYVMWVHEVDSLLSALEKEAFLPDNIRSELDRINNAFRES